MKKFLSILLSVLLTIFCLSFLGSCSKKDNNGNIVNQITPNYTVRFDTNGGSSVDSMKVKILTVAPKTFKTDYAFDAWYLDPDFTNPAKFPLSVEYDTTLYAKWIAITDTRRCADVHLKFWTGSDSTALWYITPSFDFDLLENKGFSSVKITVSYDVYYKKDYDVLWDVGYAGAPKYEVSILNSDRIGKIEKNLTTKKSTVSRTISCTEKFVDLKNQSFTLTFSTDNIQNIIYFKNIVVNYQCI